MLKRIPDDARPETNRMRRLQLDGLDILLADVDGRLYAMDNRCPHEDASLYNGALKGHCVECPLHGSRFDLRTGEPQEPPADTPVQTYAVITRDDGIYLEL